MKRLLGSLRFAAIGIAVAVAGLVYDLMYAGLPFQDPTPAMQARWEFHRSVAAFLYMTGACVFVIGLVAAPIIWRIGSRRK